MIFTTLGGEGGKLSQPKRHHYLPEFYLSRWTEEGRLWRFLRPRGPNSPVHARKAYPREVGFSKNLYRLPRVHDENDSQALEKNFLQIIDFKGAKALAKAEKNIAHSLADKQQMIQFMLSLLHRSPSRLSCLRNQLRERVAEFLNPEEDCEDLIYHSTLEVFADLVSSEFMISKLSDFKFYVINVGDDSHALMTSDRPLIISDGLHHEGSFLMLPIGPRKLLILARSHKIPEYFVAHEPRTLIVAINDAIVSQSEGLVIGTKFSDRRFIEKRLDRSSKQLIDSMGVDRIKRWKVPII